MLKIIALTASVLLATSCTNVDNLLGASDNSAYYAEQTTPALYAKKGLVTMQSNHSVQDTADKLVTIIKSKGMKVFARVDHEANAAGATLDLNPTQVIIFGNPNVGTPLMQCAPSVAIDLPQKMLISEDANQQVWLSYNNPDYLKRRHNITGCDSIISKMSNALSSISQAAIAK